MALLTYRALHADAAQSTVTSAVHAYLWHPPSASGNISPTSGKQFPILTSTPVAICIGCWDSGPLWLFV